MGTRLWNNGMITRSGCEYCNREGTFRPYDVMSHGRFVCLNHIEQAEQDWVRDNPI